MHTPQKWGSGKSYLAAFFDHFVFGFGVKGCGRVFNILRSTSSGLGVGTGFGFAVMA